MHALTSKTAVILGKFHDRKPAKFLIVFLLAVLGWGAAANSEGYYRFANRFEGWVDGPFPGPSGLPERVQGIHEAPVYHADGVTRLAGSEFLAQLYFLEAHYWTPLTTNPTNVWRALGTPAPFGTGANAGFLEVPDQDRVVGTGPLRGEKTWVQLRVWEASKGRSYEQALAARGWVGVSDGLAIAPGTRDAAAVLDRLRSIRLSSGQPKVFGLNAERIVVAVGEELRIQLVRATYEPDTRIQWFRNGVLLPGDDSQVLYRERFSPSDEGHYFARITVGGQVYETPLCIAEQRREGILSAVVEPQQPTFGQPFRMEAMIGGRGTALVRWSHRSSSGTRVISEVIRGLAEQPIQAELSVSSAELGEYSLEVQGNGFRHARTMARIEGGFRVLRGSFPQGGDFSLEPHSNYGYAPGTVVTFRMFPRAGHVFERWTGDLSGSENPKSVVIDRDLKVGAVLRNETVGSLPKAITEFNVEPRLVAPGESFRATATVQGGRGAIEGRWIYVPERGGIQTLKQERRERVEETVSFEFHGPPAQLGDYSFSARWLDGTSLFHGVAGIRGQVSLTKADVYPTWIEITPFSHYDYVRGSSLRVQAFCPPELEFVRWIGDLADRGSENPTMVVMDRSKHAEFEYRTTMAVLRTGQIRSMVVNELGQVVGPSIVGQLVGGPSPDAMAPLCPTSPVSKGSYFESELSQRGFVGVPGLAAGGRAFIQLRVWESARGGSWEAARANGGRYGQSETKELQTVNDFRLLQQASAVGSFARIVLNTAPVFGVVNGAMEVMEGQMARLQTKLNGSAPMVLEWWKDGVRLPGANREILEIAGVQASDVGSYVLRASNEFGTRDSPPIRLQMIPVPLIREVRISPNPRSREPLRIEVDATSESEFRSTWLVNGYSVLTGPGVPPLVLSEASAGRYILVLKNAVGGVFETNLLTLAPRFRLASSVEGRGQIVADPPSDGFYPAGTRVTLEALPAAQHLFVGWLDDASGADPRIELVVDRDRQVRAVFSGAGGSVHLANLIPGLGGLDAPIFDVDGVTRLAGSAFRVQLFAGLIPTALEPVGDPMVFRTGLAAGYFWSSSQRLPNVPAGVAGWVQLRAWNASAGATYDEAVRHSSPAGASAVLRIVTGGSGTPPSLPPPLEGLTSFRLEVPTAPSVVALNVPSNVDIGGTLRLEASIAGTVPVAVQWLRNGEPIPGATDVVYNFANVGPGDGGEYSVRLENLLGTVTSEVRSVAVVEPRAIEVRAEHPRILLGETATLLAEASGRPGFVVTWFAGPSGDLSKPVGQPGLELRTEALVESTRYWARVTDARGVTDSEAVWIEVIRHPQQLTLEAPDTVVFSETPIPVVATSDSGLTVVVQVVDGPAVFAEGVLKASGAGTIRIGASQEGNGRFQPATLEKSIVVEKAVAGVVLSRLEAFAEGPPVTAVATTSPPGLPVVLRYDGRSEPPVEPGSYAVSAEVDHPNYRGSASGVLKLSPPEFTLTGRVFVDGNGNGVEDAGESGLAGVTVRLRQGEVESTSTTGDSGEFGWAGLRPGHFTVEVIAPAGFQGTTPVLRTVVGQVGQPVTLAFGLQEVATVGGMVFVDTDGDGLRGGQEVGLAGVTVRVIGGDRVQVAVTSAEGFFRFTGLVPGNYEVEEEDLAGYASTTANRRSVSVTRGGAASVFFGDLPVQTISGVVFVDTNGNGIRDSEEAGVPGIVVQLFLARGNPSDGTPWREQVTAGDGTFRFEAVPVGEYVVRQILPEQYTVLTTSGLALASTRFHGAGSSGAEAGRAVRLDNGGAAAVRFGILQRGRVSGVVFEDLDGDQNQTPLERGLAGVRIDAHDASTGEPLAAAVTGSEGGYSLALSAGRALRLTQTALPGYLAAAASVVSVDAAQAAVVNFPNRTLGTVSGRVFHDENSDGDFSRGESGMGGIRVGLGSEGQGERETWTSGDGSFAFAGVAPRRVTLSVQASDGYEFSTPSQLILDGTKESAWGVQFGQRRLETQPQGPYWTWAKGRTFGPGADAPLADPDGDGISNLWEFMGGSDPLVKSPASGPLGILVTEGGNRVPAIEWNRSLPSRDLVLILERSTDLKTWEAVSSAWKVVGTADTFERVRWMDPEPIGSHGIRFLRLRVAVP